MKLLVMWVHISSKDEEIPMWIKDSYYIVKKSVEGLKVVIQNLK